ncbi:methylated-DNA--[protein]-cysteine S-methyltransferase [Candidatus Woesearchaeota archaeon]|nr:methylated-DNA--[protein]-cysteine S-methyltransferase [Candidatus Woesearchaeota archaeon]
MMKFKQNVYELVKKIPRGKVSTYKHIAENLNSGAYRAVGQILKNNKNPNVPCHRVVASNGTIGGFRGETKGEAIKDKINILQKEGIKFENNMIIDFEEKLFFFL